LRGCGSLSTHLVAVENSSSYTGRVTGPALGRDQCGGRSRVGAMQWCAELFVIRHRTCVDLTMRPW